MPQSSKTRRILSGERVFTCGRTGSGKTYIARHLCARVSRLIVLDGKGSLFTWGLDDWNRNTARALAGGKPVRARVVADVDSPGQTWESAMRAVWEAGDCTLFVDEVYSIVEPGRPAPAVMSAIWTRGREYGIGAWASTQRPASVPLFTISEAGHYFVFRLTLEEDRKRMASFMGPEVMKPIRDKHGFYYMGAEDDSPAYHPIFSKGVRL